jgi:hypothetical protein
MEFDPNHPQPNTLADANLMRGQLNSLNDSIAALNTEHYLPLFARHLLFCFAFRHLLLFSVIVCFEASR